MSTGNGSEDTREDGGIDWEEAADKVHEDYKDLWAKLATALACGLCGDITHNTPDSPTCEQCGRILCDECGENIGLCWDHSENPL